MKRRASPATSYADMSDEDFLAVLDANTSRNHRLTAYPACIYPDCILRPHDVGPCVTEHWRTGEQTQRVRPFLFELVLVPKYAEGSALDQDRHDADNVRRAQMDTYHNYGTPRLRPVGEGHTGPSIVWVTAGPGEKCLNPKCSELIPVKPPHTKGKQRMNTCSTNCAQAWLLYRNYFDDTKPTRAELETRRMAKLASGGHTGLSTDGTKRPRWEHELRATGEEKTRHNPLIEAPPTVL